MICSTSAISVVQPKRTEHVCKILPASSPSVTRASGEEQSDPARRSLVKRCQKSESLSRLAALQFDFVLAPKLCALVLQNEPVI